VLFYIILGVKNDVALFCAVFEHVNNVLLLLGAL